jgi:hypothetical protein
LRLAWFETAKAALIANQTLEPTQIAGFNQMYDDPNGTRAQRMGIGLDTHVASNLYGGLEASKRNLDVPFARDLITPTLGRIEKQHENLYRAYLYRFPHPHIAIKGELQYEKFARNATDAQSNPSLIETSRLPLTLNYFNPNGIFTNITTTYLMQNLKRGNTSAYSGTSDFFLLDATIGYRFAKRRGIVALEGRNLLDEHFIYRTENFQISEATPPRFTPTRTILVRLTLNF